MQGDSEPVHGGLPYNAPPTTTSWSLRCMLSILLVKSLHVEGGTKLPLSDTRPMVWHAVNFLCIQSQSSSRLVRSRRLPSYYSPYISDKRTCNFYSLRAATSEGRTRGLLLCNSALWLKNLKRLNWTCFLPTDGAGYWSWVWPVTWSIACVYMYFPDVQVVFW